VDWIQLTQVGSNGGLVGFCEHKNDNHSDSINFSIKTLHHTASSYLDAVFVLREVSINLNKK
jgi:hypothetical protein